MAEVKLIATHQSFPCARVEWALRMKGVEYEYLKEDLANKSPLLLQSNPVHKKVPVLLHNDKPIAESLVILEYIDETWKENPLLPLDSCERAQARFWAKFIDEKCVLGVWGAAVAQGEEKGKAADAALESLAFLEKEIQGKKYFGGDKIGYLDIAAGCMSLWFSVLEELGEMELINAERFPSLHEWSQNFLQTSPVKDCIPSRESVIEYFSYGINYVRSLASNKS